MDTSTLQIIIIPVAALMASGLTFFSGFGLGTILMPVFLIFFPIDTSIALTAVVHFLNNILKFVLLWKKADRAIVLRFGLPAFVTAFIGAQAIFILKKVPPIYAYSLFEKEMSITLFKLTIAVLILSFLLLEKMPKFKNISFHPRYLPLGGCVSGFFGGLSGHQGALRSMFLLKAGLSKESFIATGVVIACLVDLSRIFVYGKYLAGSAYQDHGPLLGLTVLAAFAGVFAGNRLIKKITMNTVQMIVSILLLTIAMLLGAGVI